MLRRSENYARVSFWLSLVEYDSAETILGFSDLAL
jgi:hypothetical protein